MTIIIFFICLVFASTCGASTNITISEALPSGVAGLSRSDEPVTVGVPLPENSGITSVSSLGLSGTSVGQFRPLAWWPNGNIKWVLVDTLASVSAGGTATVAVTDGTTGNFGGSNLATDGDTVITVNTGAAQFTIRKANFNVFNQVVVNSNTLVSSSNGGRVEAVGLDGTIYSSQNDPNSTAVIEENGPVKSVLKATGSLLSSGGARLCDYTVRLYFYKGKSYVKGNVVLRNANKNYPTHVGFLSSQIVVTTSLSSGKTALFSRSSDVVSRSLSDEDTAYLYQGYNNRRSVNYATNCYSWSPPVPGTCSNTVYTYNTSYLGLLVKIGAETINSLGTSSDYSQGFASLKDGNNNSVAVAMRWLSENWPGGFEVKGNGDVSIELFSKYNNSQQLKLPFNSHEGREVIWDFRSTGAAGDQDTLYSLQYPLIGKVDFNQYASTKVLYGQDSFVSTSDEGTFFATIGTRSSRTFSNPSFDTYYRQWYWPATGGSNQTDSTLSNFIDYMRTGNAGNYLTAEQRSIYNANSAIPRSDGYTMSSVTMGTDPLSTSVGINGRRIDFEHANIGDIPIYYFISGNEGIKDAYIDYVEYLNYTQSSEYYSIPAYFYYSRAAFRRMRNTALAHEFMKSIGQSSFVNIASITDAMSYVIDSNDVPGQLYPPTATVGRNRDRGYFFADNTVCMQSGSTWSSGCNSTYNGRDLHSFFHTQIGFEAFWQVFRVLKDEGSYNRILELEDFMTGLSQFFFKEYVYLSGSVYQGNYDYPLDYYQSTQNPAPYQITRAGLWAYQHTGDTTILQQAATTAGAGGYSPTELQDQAMIWAYNNRTTLPIWQTLTLSVVNNGSGSYTLSWAVPASASQIRIKSSPSAARQIVEWLGFDKITRTYQYDPANYIAYFAANNVSQPSPATPGSAQTVTLTGLPTGLTSNNFAAKYITGTASLVPGICGTSNGLSLSSAPITGLCSAGTPSAVTGTGPFLWTCAGSGGGGAASCGAALANQARTVSIKLGSGGKMTGILR